MVLNFLRLCISKKLWCMLKFHFFVVIFFLLYATIFHFLVIHQHAPFSTVLFLYPFSVNKLHTRRQAFTFSVFLCKSLKDHICVQFAFLFCMTVTHNVTLPFSGLYLFFWNLKAFVKWYYALLLLHLFSYTEYLQIWFPNHTKHSQFCLNLKPVLFSCELNFIWYLAFPRNSIT